jgi:hypothetical protein
MVERGLEGTLKRKEQVTPRRLPRFHGEAEARLITLSCSTSPEGCSQCTFKLLAEKAAELKIIAGSVSHRTVRQASQETTLKPHQRKMWMIRRSTRDEELCRGATGDRPTTIYE